jgi:hypothetical protein
MTTIQSYINSSLIQDYIENLELGLHPEMLQPVLDSLNISWVKDVLKKNPSINAPYHNNKHTTSVILNSYEGGRLEKVDNLKLLVIAAGFHDFDHIGKVDNDHISIPKAIAALNIYAKEYLSENDLEIVSNLISSTYYPYKNEPFNVEEKILRDADLMQIYEKVDSTLLEIYAGLRKEIEASKNIEISSNEFIEMNKKFHSNVSWYTQWAKSKSNRFSIQCQKMYTVLQQND